MAITQVSRAVIQDYFIPFVNVKEFGAVGDGVTDDTPAFLEAIGFNTGSLIVLIPAGWYRMTSALPMRSGLSFHGDSSVNMSYGVPTNDERPSHVFIDSDTGVLFDHADGVQMESVHFYDLSFGARLFNNTTPRGSATGFDFSGSWPDDIKHLSYTRCSFANFGGYAIRVRDPLAPHGDPDWNVCPAQMTDCTFYYNTIGIEFEADNADCWDLSSCSFFGTTYGVSLKRGGILTMQNCIGGGAGTTMVISTGSIRDNITLIGCQYEDATAFVHIADSLSETPYRQVRLISCVIEAPIIIASRCHLITDGCRWVNNLEVTSNNSVIDSISDTFLPSTAFNIAAGSLVRNFISSGGDYPIGVRGPIMDGKCYKTDIGVPVSGAYFVGDIVWNSAPATGSPLGWVCSASGSPGTWLAFGEIGIRSGAGTPVNAVTPNYIGEEYLDTSTNIFYKAYGLAGNLWAALN